MIVVDTSILVAILRQEPDGTFWMNRLLSEARLAIGAPTKFELLLVMTRGQGVIGASDANALLDVLKLDVIDWTDAMADIASEAFATYGKGLGHRAALNFGDCMAYALAKSLDAPLLFKGNDFALTDVKRAL